jgi:glucose/mannose transport system substrate-binding protein
MGKDSELEIVHCWKTKSERRALDSLLDLYRQKHPETNIIEDTRGNIAEVKAVVKRRIIDKLFPDTFQNTYGPSVIRSWQPYLEPVNELFEDFPIPNTLKKWGKIGSDYYSIPLNLHRDNNLWCSMKITDKLGIEMPLKEVDDFFEACEKIKRKGYIPFVFGTRGQSFWLNWILEWFIVSETGGGRYLSEFYSGRIEPAGEPAVKKALLLFKKLWREFINPNWDALTWNEAGDVLLREEGVFNVMGDWQKAHFMASGWKPWEDFYFQTVPGTDGVSVVHGNCFGLIKGAPHPNVTNEFLKLIKTVEAEEIFCRIKSASPPRTDCPLERFDSMQKEIIMSIRSDELVPNVLGLTDFWINKTSDIFETFCRTLDINSTLAKLNVAYKEAFPDGGVSLG